jgi:hypothetical protein
MPKTIKDLTEFQQRAFAAGVTKMLSGSYFSIFDFDTLCKTLDVPNSGTDDHIALRNMHCVDWGAMGPELAKLTRNKAIELLGIPYAPVMDTPAYAAEPKSTVATMLLKLFKTVA